MVQRISDYVAVMYLGRIVEFGSADQVFRDPKHPYTRALLDAVLTADPERRRAPGSRVTELVGPLGTPSGCRFRPRCSSRIGRCADEDPPDHAVASGRMAACHLLDPALAADERRLAGLPRPGG